MTERAPDPQFVGGYKDVLDFPGRKMAVDFKIIVILTRTY